MTVHPRPTADLVDDIGPDGPILRPWTSLTGIDTFNPATTDLASPIAMEFADETLRVAPGATATTRIALRADAQATPPHTAPAPSSPKPFEDLDTNGDGAISKDEAAVDPPLAQAFGTLDIDADGRLTPEEYAVYAQGQS